MTTDPQTACPNCQHDQHLPGTDCDAVIEHGPKRWHRCLCMARPGAALPCPPQMTCQGGTLGYADIWYLQHGHTLASADGEISPEVLSQTGVMSVGFPSGAPGLAAAVPVAAPPTTEQAAAVASCPGYETSPNPCRCPCEGCKHHCGAHDPSTVTDAVLPAPADRAAVVPPPALTEEGRLRMQVEVLQQDAERDQGLAKVGARCMREGHQGLIEQGRLVLEGWRFALSTALDLGTGAPWEAIHERVKELRPAAVEAGQAGGPSREATEPQPETQTAAGIVAYRSGGGRLLRCVAHAPAQVAITIGAFHPVTAEDLPDGGICKYPDCGVDVLLAAAPAVSSRPGTEQEA